MAPRSQAPRRSSPIRAATARHGGTAGPSRIAALVACPPVVTEVTHHALLGVACASLLAAGLRIAARGSERLVDRALAAFVLAVGFAVVEALALGIVRLGSDAVALTVAAV